MKTTLLFERYEIEYIELEKEIEKNQLLCNIVDYGVINEASVLDYHNKEEDYILHSYTVDYEEETYLFYEKVYSPKEKKGKYKSIEIFKLDK